MISRFLKSAAAGLLPLLVAVPAAAQTYTWTGGGSNANWSTAANWDTLPPAGGAATAAIVLNGTLRTVTNQDRGNPFVLNSLAMNTDGSATAGFTVAGSPLQFAGAGASITVNTNGSGQPGNPLQIRSAVDVAAALAINLPSASGDNANPYELVISSALLNANAIVQNGTAIGTNVLLAARNNPYSGTYTATGSTTLFIGADNALNRQSSLVLSTSFGGLSTGIAASPLVGTTAAAYSFSLGSLSGSNAGAILSVGDAANFATLLAGFKNNAADIYAGAITISNAASHFGKVGTGSFSLTGPNNNIQGSISVRDGTLILSGNGSLGTQVASPTGTYTLAVYAGTTAVPTEVRLVTGASTIGRIQNNASIVLGGGLLHFNGSGQSASGTGLVEITGALALASGQSAVLVDAAAGRGVGLQFASYSAGTAGGTAFFQGTALGASPVNTPNTANIAFVGAPALVGGGGAAGSTNISILPSGFGSTAGTGAMPDTLVTVGANGVRPLTSGEYLATFASGQTLTDNVNLTGAAPALAGPTTINSLVLATPTALVLTATSLTLTSGALLNASAPASIAGSTTLQFGPAAAPATAYVTVSNALAISVPVAAANLSKSGGGTLTLSGGAALGANATVAVNAGTLAIAGPAITSASGTLSYLVSSQAVLDVTAGGLSLNAGQSLLGNGSVSGAVTVASGGTVAPSALGGPSATLASPGTLTISATTFQSGGTYTWYVGSASGGTYTSSKISGSILNVTGTQASPFNLKVVSLAASNSPGKVYDFDPAVATSWVLGSFATVNGFAGNAFAVDSSAFQNPLAGGTFAVSLQNANQDLVLTFTPLPVPEPAELLVLGALAALGAAGARRVRWKCPALACHAKS